MEDDKTNVITQISEFKDDKVWVTKKSRMESEARMKKNDMIPQIAIVYYTFVAMIISVYGIVNNDNNLGVLSLVISIGLFGLSLFISVVDFKGKAQGYKEAYTQLIDVENNLENLMDTEENYQELCNKFKQLKEQYYSIVKLTENHSTMDFYVIKNRQQRDFKFKEILIYKITYKVIITLIFILPIVIMILFWGD